jgi:hypothetical protein
MILIIGGAIVLLAVLWLAETHAGDWRSK